MGIYLDPHEKEHIIFETLNARGEPLTEWDKIKNYLLYKADAEPSLDQESFFETYLDAFDDPWWRKAVGRGAQRRPRTDVFVDYWLESRTRNSVAVRRVFREFQKHIDAQPYRLEKTVQELVSDAQYFRQFESQSDRISTREELFHSRRRDVNLGALWPLLLELQRLSADESDRDQWFAILESYFIRRLITRHQARAYDSLALDLLNVIWEGDTSPQAIGLTIKNHLLSFDRPGRIWPNDAEVKRSVLDRTLPTYAHKLVLSALERYLISKWTASVDLSPTVQVEHIMPQGWKTESWPLVDSVERTQAEEQRNHLIQTLGNVTLLNGRLNSTIRNSPWARKRAAIKRSDNLYLNRRLLEQASDSWTEESIRRRGCWIHSLVVRIWPHG